MKLNLPDSVYSSQDLTALILELKEYGRWLSHTNIAARVNAKHISESPVTSPAATVLLREWSVKNTLTPQRLDELLKALETFQKTASALTITLAAPPTSDIKQTLVAWCRKNITDNILVTFQFNATLLGGMVIRYGSHIFDWSFRRQILAARDKFPEVLRRV